MYMIGYSNFNIYPTRTRVKIIGFEKKTCILLEQKYLNISQSDVPRSSVDKR